MKQRKVRENMPVQLLCPNLRCRKFLAVPDDVRGKLVKCHHCQQLFRVPTSKKSDQAEGPSPAAPAAKASH